MTVIEMQDYDYRAVYIPASHTVMYIRDDLGYTGDKEFVIEVCGHERAFELARYETREAADEALWRIIHAMEEERYIDPSVIETGN